MYWLNSKFVINKKSDLEFLANFYDKVSGELNVKRGDTEIASVQWTINPFRALLELPELPSYPFDIWSRLVGPDTVKAAAQLVTKLDPNTFQHTKRELIMEWANYIDLQVKNEMKRSNDMAMYFERPKQNLSSMPELMLAVKLSKYATHVVIHSSCFIIANTDSAYLSMIGLTPESHCVSSLMFDTDDGFSSPFEPNSQSVRYLNTRFNLWKESGYQGKMADYYENFDNNILNIGE